MPYIKEEDRQKFSSHIDDEGNPQEINLLKEVSARCNNAGDLNYALTMILKHYLEKKGESYAVHNEILGMLDCCGKEWYRKRTAIYEDLKIKQNGDV